MSQDLLDGEQIDSGFQQFRGERVPQGVSAEAAFQAGTEFGSLQGSPRSRRSQGPVWSRLGNSHTGLRCVFQNRRSSVSSLCERGTSRCLFPLPRATRIVMRRLSMSATRRCTASPTRIPVAYIVVSSIRCLRDENALQEFQDLVAAEDHGNLFRLLAERQPRDVILAAQRGPIEET